jgi:hypothetical protein
LYDELTPVAVSLQPGKPQQKAHRALTGYETQDTKYGRQEREYSNTLQHKAAPQQYPQFKLLPPYHI